jgi:hypothetical protein
VFLLPVSFVEEGKGGSRWRPGVRRKAEWLGRIRERLAWYWIERKGEKDHSSIDDGDEHAPLVRRKRNGEDLVFARRGTGRRGVGPAKEKGSGRREENWASERGKEDGPRKGAREGEGFSFSILFATF